jgi:hypothetical protein
MSFVSLVPLAEPKYRFFPAQPLATSTLDTMTTTANGAMRAPPDLRRRTGSPRLLRPSDPPAADAS